MEPEGYKYIIEARIKNETNEIRHWILSQDRQDGCFYEPGKPPHSRLIVGYSGKDTHNRDKGIKHLQKACKSGHITKENINKRGYNKFLKISNSVSVTINHDKTIEDAKWDGLKSYLTNTSLPASEVYDHYSELWQIERTFRITKRTPQADWKSDVLRATCGIQYYFPPAPARLFSRVLLFFLDRDFSLTSLWIDTENKANTVATKPFKSKNQRMFIYMNINIL